MSDVYWVYSVKRSNGINGMMDRKDEDCITRKASRGLNIHEIPGLIINQVTGNYAIMRYATYRTWSSRVPRRFVEMT